MASVWPDVQRVFETLSYILKGMSPDGTELYYTISYDTFRRKDPKDLYEHMEKKATAGTTNINFRLNLLLEGFRVRRPKLLAGGKKKNVVRPISLYVLTNGEWLSDGPDPKITIQKTADSLVASNMSNEQLTIQFISFAKSPTGIQKLNDLAKTDFGM